MPELLNYRVEGSGEPLVLVHGFAISFHIWKNLLPLLRPHFSVVMLELPGVGGSAMPAAGQDYLASAVQGIEAVRLAMGLEKWKVLGYSTGSRIVEAYCRSHDAQVGKAIFLCPLQLHRMALRTLRLGLWLDERAPVFGDWILSGWRLKFLVSWLGFNLKPDPLGDEWYQEIRAAPMRLRKETIRLAVPHGAERFEPGVPFEMIWADHDAVPATPRRPGPHDHFVHGQHAAPVEAAEEVGRVIEELLKEHEQGVENGK